VTDVTRALLIWLVLLAATAAIAAITGWSAWRTRNRHQPAALGGAEWDRALAAERADEVREAIRDDDRYKRLLDGLGDDL